MGDTAVNKEMIIKDIDGKTVVVDIDAATYFTFNETGNLIWKCLLDGKDFEATKESITNEFTVSSEEFDKDYKAFIDDLKSKNLLKEATHGKEG